MQITSLMRIKSFEAIMTRRGGVTVPRATRCTRRVAPVQPSHFAPSKALQPGPPCGPRVAARPVRYAPPVARAGQRDSPVGSAPASPSRYQPPPPASPLSAECRVPRRLRRPRGGPLAHREPRSIFYTTVVASRPKKGRSRGAGSISHMKKNPGCHRLGLHTTPLFRGRQGRTTDKTPYWRPIRQPKRPHDAPSSTLNIRNVGQVAPILCSHMSFLCQDWVPVPNQGAQPPPAESYRPPWEFSLRDALLTPFWVGALGAHDAQMAPWWRP